MTTYQELVLLWDETYRTIHADENVDVEAWEALVNQFNERMQDAYNRGEIEDKDALHFMALICYLGRGE